jgi:hypothetical protein
MVQKRRMGLEQKNPIGDFFLQRGQTMVVVALK